MTRVAAHEQGVVLDVDGGRRQAAPAQCERAGEYAKGRGRYARVQPASLGEGGGGTGNDGDVAGRRLAGAAPAFRGHRVLHAAAARPLVAAVRAVVARVSRGRLCRALRGRCHGRGCAQRAGVRGVRQCRVVGAAACRPMRVRGSLRSHRGHIGCTDAPAPPAGVAPTIRVVSLARCEGRDKLRNVARTRVALGPRVLNSVKLQPAPNGCACAYTVHARQKDISACRIGTSLPHFMELYTVL